MQSGACNRETLPPLHTPNSGSTDSIVVRGNDVWVTANFNKLVRYNVVSGLFTEFPLGTETDPIQPADIVFGAAGDVWLSAPLDGTIKRFDPRSSSLPTGTPGTP